ncbi:bifunctional proline dehydrogenase/L-glutamate gamma-semialdehyde dehydrogenase PutA [Roseibium sp.]|uniref:bifunctional proline dehydrogenase/L-glutamate gamma-semialdehyde dehydrogenase PutA n=1 Tax=Roseibium sp. TaxID=1936156 RepID=UPI003A97EAB5
MLAMQTDLDTIDALKHQDETALLLTLARQAALGESERAGIVANAADLVRQIRQDRRQGLMEVFLAEYGLSSEEGIALMCLAEALLRVPDAATIDELIEDKIVRHNWSRHRWKSQSPLVNSSTIGLELTAKLLEGAPPGLAGIVRGAVKRLGEPVIRAAVAQGMREMGRQFVLGETIDSAMQRAGAQEEKGFTYSYDMLGEAAMTASAATRYKRSYADTIAALAKVSGASDCLDNPGVSVKLSALHPRYEALKEDRVLAELGPVLLELALMAREANIGLTVDAEEADRLVLSLKVIEMVLRDERLAGWDGFGLVVQAYSRRAGAVIDWLYDIAWKLDRKITVRLVKGAYWDSEIKHAQVEGLDGFPVFTRKPASDVSYIANARKLLGMTHHIFPQFATHNAHTVAAILHMAQEVSPESYEFQRLHGMGEKLHGLVKRQNGTRCRIYAPVGAHRDLLAYLVRRLLENGANSSFVNQIVDERIAPETVVSCPFSALEKLSLLPEPGIKLPANLFGPERRNSRGMDLSSAVVLGKLRQSREAPLVDVSATSLLADRASDGETLAVVNPASGRQIGTVQVASDGDVRGAIAAAQVWGEGVGRRAEVLKRAADLYEAHSDRFFSLLTLEAGKTIADAIGELREAVDFLRYYANEACGVTGPPRGVFTCISPWNFPLAIFTGQIAAALATGNGVLAKPAEQTSLIAFEAVKLLHEAGVPQEALQLVIGPGSRVGAALTSDPHVQGVAFTGSTQTAKRIRRAIAEALSPDAPLIAETGGLNAMIVDSTALPEQAVRDIVASAFQSAGQRCSALRCLYVQEDIASDLIAMIEGAMEELQVGEPWQLSTDVGPVIDEAARQNIVDHIEEANAAGRLIKQLETPSTGWFVGPALIRISGIADLEREIFGPVLHVATFRAEDLEQVIADINSCGYGLTFGLHTRISGRAVKFGSEMQVGNVYVNRNQIGAIVGSQPFGGEGLSGTGPKAGGPNYLARFVSHPRSVTQVGEDKHREATQGLGEIQDQIHAASVEREVRKLELPGPTGESNTLNLHVREPLLCLGPGKEAVAVQVSCVERLGGNAVAIPDKLPAVLLQELNGFSAVIWWGDEDEGRHYAQALSLREGAILPLICGAPDLGHVMHERHVCIDTTAAGGNAALLAQSANVAGLG